MKIIIVGAGRIGANLAKALSKEDHEVYLIEKDEEIARQSDEKLDVKVICGNGTDPDLLRGLKIGETDLFIAVTFSDETNLIACSLATYLGAKRQLARVRNNALSSLIKRSEYEHFKIDEIINPEKLSSEAILKAIDTPGAREVGDFANGKIFLRSFVVPCHSPLCGVKIETFREEDFPWPFLIIAISRDRNVVIPKGNTVIKPFDRIYVLLPAASLGEFISFINPELKKPQKVVIYGATQTGEYIASSLTKRIKDLILLEENAQLAADAAERLPHARVIHGSASEKDILNECGIETADVFIATSDNDHSNLISAVLAKKMGAKATIITTQQPDYITIVDALSIDVIINPHLLAVEQILKFVRGKGISAVTKLLECDAEALEFITEVDAPITKAKIKDIHFPKNCIVGAVSRGADVFLASGDTQIQQGERVIVFCQENSVKKVQSLFTRKKYFA